MNPQHSELAPQFARFLPEAVKSHARLTAVSLAKTDRNISRLTIAIELQEHRQCDVCQEKLLRDAAQEGFQLLRSHQPVGNICVPAIGACGDQKKHSKHETRHHSPPAVLSSAPHSVEHIMTMSFTPEPEEKLRITLPVGIDLKDERNLPATCFTVNSIPRSFSS